MSICDNTTVNQETTLKLQSTRKNKNMLQCLQRKLSMTLKLDGVPRYFIKKVFSHNIYNRKYRQFSLLSFRINDFFFCWPFRYLFAFINTVLCKLIGTFEVNLKKTEFLDFISTEINAKLTN